MAAIDPDITIEDLVREHPKAVKFLAERGIRCIACGEPIWGTLREAAAEKGFDEEAITKLTEELSEFLDQ